jgi:hypothetical protein
MKRAITAIISLTAILAGLALLAQESPRPATGGGLAERFKQLDKNGDGKLTGDEASEAVRNRFDANKDGVVTIEEAGGDGAKKKRPAVKWVKPSEDMTGKKAGQALDPRLVWKRSLQLPLTDSAGKTLVGTEILELAPHGGRLYANNSHWGDTEKRDRNSVGGFVYAGASQVFVKDGVDAPWRVDVQLGPEVTR